MYTLPGVDPVFNLKEANTVLTLARVPVKLIRVKLEEIVYPVLAETPAVVLNRRVVPAGGLTNPTVINKLEAALNPDTEKPLTT
jgi:hypothetical protein